MSPRTKIEYVAARKPFRTFFSKPEYSQDIIPPEWYVLNHTAGLFFHSSFALLLYVSMIRSTLVWLFLVYKRAVTACLGLVCSVTLIWEIVLKSTALTGRLQRPLLV